MPRRPALDLEKIAERTIARTLESLPADIRSAAMECTIVCIARPTAEQIIDPDDEDLLGLFEGLSRLDPPPGEPSEMPRISLFLENLFDHADGDLQEFRDELRITLLHELGHYLGLDEEEVEDLGLG